VLLPENEQQYCFVDRDMRGERERDAWRERKLRSGRFVCALSAHAIPTFSHHKIHFGPKKKKPDPLSPSPKQKNKTQLSPPQQGKHKPRHQKDHPDFTPMNQHSVVGSRTHTAPAKR
jgi:hypothetical protein